MAENILLINLPLSDLSTTPFFVMPPGLLSIAAYLKKRGESVEFVDLNVVRKHSHPKDLNEAFESRLEESKPNLIGISVMVAGQFGLAEQLCRRAKQIIPGVVTMLGGAHVTQFPDEILKNCPQIDFVIIGEGEEQAHAVAKYAKTGAAPSSWPDGMAYRSNGNGNCSVTVLPKYQYIPDVDNLPWPAYELLDVQDYRHDTRTWHNPYQVDLSLRIPIITSRGCPNLCNFCSVARCMGLKYRAMSAINVVDMLQMLYEKYDASYFAIFDANFAQDTNRVIDICNEITKRNLKILLDLPTGLPINTTAPIIIDALAGAGLIRTCISVETGDDYIRNDVMLKKVDHDQIFTVIDAIRRYPQIFLLTDFVMGMPEDTKESLEVSCRLIEELDSDDITLSIATPYPGTSLFDQCIRDNLLLPDVILEDLYKTPWYSHSNTDIFTIKPYKLNLIQLHEYRDRILSMRQAKFLLYSARMKEQFGIHILMRTN